MGTQLLIGLTLGRRFCVTCVAYFVLIQPRAGEGPLEDSRPPRLANMIGFVFLSAAALAWWLGSPTAGIVLGRIVAALALVAATSGFCTGCELYKLGARLRGISPRHHITSSQRTSPPRATPAPSSSSPTRSARSAMSGSGDSRRPDPLITLDVRERPDLARKYGVAVVPTVIVVAGDGAVLERLAP